MTVMMYYYYLCVVGSKIQYFTLTSDIPNMPMEGDQISPLLYIIHVEPLLT